MISEYKQQFGQKGQILDFWTRIPENKKEMLHNKFKGRGNYALLDDLVGGNGSILTRYNAFCKKNGMPCFVKCCSKNPDCANVGCTSDGRPDDSRFSTFECVSDPSHAILQSHHHAPTACDAASSGPAGCSEEIDARMKEADTPLCAGRKEEEEEGIAEVGRASDACARQNRQYRCECNEPLPWCSLCSETKKCRLDEIDASWREVCEEVFAFDDKIGLSMITKLKGLLSRMENLETVWLCENCQHFLNMRVDLLRNNCQMPCAGTANYSPMNLCGGQQNCGTPSPCGNEIPTFCGNLQNCGTRPSCGNGNRTFCGNGNSWCHIARPSYCFCGSGCSIGDGCRAHQYPQMGCSTTPSTCDKLSQDRKPSGPKTSEPKTSDPKTSDPKTSDLKTPTNTEETQGKEDSVPRKKSSDEMVTVTVTASTMAAAGNANKAKKNDRNQNKNSSKSPPKMSPYTPAFSSSTPSNRTPGAASRAVAASAPNLGTKSSKTTSAAPRRKDGATQIDSSLFLDCQDCDCCN